MEKTIKELKQEYKEFLNEISSNLEKIKLLLKIEKMHFSQDEINNSVNLYFSNYKNPNTLDLSEREFENIIDAYWGEAFKHYNGGEWALNLSKKDKAYGTPTIEKWGGDD